LKVCVLKSENFDVGTDASPEW